MPSPRASARRAPKGLDRDLIIGTALRLIDDGGLQALSMRSLAQQLGVEAMSLYRYVSGREDLLESVVVRLTDGLQAELDPGIVDSWQGYLQGVGNAVRRVAIDHPSAFPLLATRHPAAPWLRPPLRDIALVESFLSTLSGFGFSDDQVVEIYRAFSSFLLGHLLLETSVRGAETSPIEEPLDEGGATVPNLDGAQRIADTTMIVRMRSLLSEDRSEEEFEISLEALLNRLELAYTQ